MSYQQLLKLTTCNFQNVSKMLRRLFVFLFSWFMEVTPSSISPTNAHLIYITIACFYSYMFRRHYSIFRESIHQYLKRTNVKEITTVILLRCSISKAKSYCNLLYLVGWDSVVDIATHYGLNGPGIEPWWGRDFPHPPPSQTWGPPSLLYNGQQVSLPQLKRPGRGIDHPHPSNSEVKERVELHLYSTFGPSWSA
jgi:hypothetical protein